MGKRAWRTPIPHLSLLDRKAGQGLIVFADEETSNIEHPTPNEKTSRVDCASLDVGVEC
jgi:hypothetical protein